MGVLLVKVLKREGTRVRKKGNKGNFLLADYVKYPYLWCP
jgi:hypothetical protein